MLSPGALKVVKDEETKDNLARATYGESFIAHAPVIFVCCADINGYLDGMVSGIQDLGRIGAVEDGVVNIVLRGAERMKTMSVQELGPILALNVAVAVEHIVLRALDFHLGTCWVRLFNESKIRDMFSWNENVHVVALLPIGYPDESPLPRRRVKIEDLLID